jgi:hypothetical protein
MPIADQPVLLDIPEQPEQMAKPQRGELKLRSVNRQQTMLAHIYVEDLVPLDHKVRAIEKLVERLACRPECPLRPACRPPTRIPQAQSSGGRPSVLKRAPTWRPIPHASITRSACASWRLGWNKAITYDAVFLETLVLHVLYHARCHAEVCKSRFRATSA